MLWLASHTKLGISVYYSNWLCSYHLYAKCWVLLNRLINKQHCSVHCLVWLFILIALLWAVCIPQLCVSRNRFICVCCFFEYASCMDSNASARSSLQLYWDSSRYGRGYHHVPTRWWSWTWVVFRPIPTCSGRTGHRYCTLGVLRIAVFLVSTLLHFCMFDSGVEFARKETLNSTRN